MKLFAALLAFLAFILAGFSWKCVAFYSFFAVVSWGLTYIFLSNKCELEFEIIFKVFERIGYGAPRFLENKPFSSSENTTDGHEVMCKIPAPISKRIDVLIENVSRDFIASWYHEVAEGDVFIDESKAALQKLSTDIYQRMTNLDSHYLTEQIIVVFHAHLERFNKAVRVLKDKDPKLKLSITSSQLLHQTYESQIPTKHIALKNPSSELNYLRTVVDSLLAALLPPNIFSCDMGRFILREILAVQLVDLVNLLTDPDWVNEAIIDLLSPPKQLSDILREPKQINETKDQAIKKNAGSIENSIGISSTLPAGINIASERSVTKVSFGNQVSIGESGQVRSRQQSSAERDLDKDLAIKDNTIVKIDKEGQLERNNEAVFINSSYSTHNENIKTHSDSLNENSIVWSCAEKDQEMSGSAKTSGLSSSWGFLPSSEDKTFQTQSFEAIKQQAIERERLKNITPKFVEFGSDVKRLSSCCTRFQTSDDFEGNPQNDYTKIRSRTTSLPEALNLVSNGIENRNKIYMDQRKVFQRSVSFPNNICSIVDNNEPLDPRPLRSSTIDPIPVYGSPYYNISFCSSDGSFKSFSDDGMDIEEGEEMDEGTDSDSSEILEDIAPLPIMKTAKTSAIPRECKNDNDTKEKLLKHEGSKRQRKLGFAKNRGFFKDSFEGGSGTVGSTEDTNFEKSNFNGFHENRYRSNDSKDSDSSDPRSPLETLPPSQRLESDPSFGDSVKKFISSFKSPVKRFGFSSGSSKSASTSSGADSMDVNVPSSIDNASFDSDLPFSRPVRKNKTDSPSSARKLSRSQAVVDVSSDSESETWYGTPAAAVKEEIVYGVMSSSSGDTVDSDNKTVVKIHPSKLICIPSSETALESEGEPGRNKFTLYRIEYDIRIWPSVYKAVIEEEQQESAEEKEATSHKKKTIPCKRAIKRRYREFMELHSRLCNGPMAMYMKDILKPNRKYNLPFGRLDKDVVEGRRHLLQNYLVSLVSKPELRDCDELKQFLGVIGGVSFIRPSVAQIMSQSVHVPRVDKMLSRQMTKVIDSIKTALEIEGQEVMEDNKMPDAVDSTSCPWTIVRQRSLDEPTVMTNKEEVLPADCFSAFLETFESSTSQCRHHVTDTDDSYEESNDDDDGNNDLYLHWPKTAGDSSDTPNEPSTASAVSKDDMLNGVLGSHPPGLCIPCTLPHSASTGSLNANDTVDFGKQWLQEYVHEQKPISEAAYTDPLPSSMDQPMDSLNESKKATFTHQLGFSKKNVERLKHAAQKAKEKKIESMENLGHAKDKVKTFSKEKKFETFEHFGHAKDKVKTFTKEKKIEPLEQLSHAKEKLKTFSMENKFEPMEHVSHAKEKVKRFSKEKKMETDEHLSHAKEKVKAFSKVKKIETMENLGQVKHRVTAFSKEKKAETAEQLSLAKDKVKAYSKEKKVESIESLNQAKDKVKEFQKKLSDSKKLIKKGCSSHPSHMDDEKEDDSAVVAAKKTAVLTHKRTAKCTNGTERSLDQKLNVSSSDNQSHCITEVTQGITVEELQFPLAHVIVDLACEVLKGQDSWASLDRVQEGFLGIFGALFEWFVRSEIDDLFLDDCWGVYLDNLIKVVWPNGKLIEPSGEKKSVEQKEKTKKKAVNTLMEFFPDVFPLFVGSWVYKDCAKNAVESLQNPVINRILIYILLELFLLEIIPELQRNIDIDWQEILE